MEKVLDLSKSVHDLAEQYPEFVDAMVEIGFAEIAKPVARNTVGRVMTVPKGAQIKGIDLDAAIKVFEEHGFTVSWGGDVPSAAAEDKADADDRGRTEENGKGGQSEELDEEGRGKLLESYVSRLSDGEELESVRADFVEHFEDVDAAEIARAEQNLIEKGAKVIDVQRLCDVHSALFHGATREEKIANAENAVMSSLKSEKEARASKVQELAGIEGHPVNMFSRENDAIAEQLDRVRATIGSDEVVEELTRLRQVGTHYAKKGDLLYPILNVTYGFSGPSEVMWGVDDEIREELGIVAGAKKRDGVWRERTEAVLTRAEEMIFKERNILVPLCVERFSDDEWLQMYADLKGYELCLIDDAGTWDEGESFISEKRAQAELSARDGMVKLGGGSLTPAQLNALLDALPFEITFIDEDQINRYWNDNGEKKLFKRPESAIGREVWSCHPPKVQEMVSGVIAQLKGGEKSVDIWMKKGGEPVLVRYMAVRDKAGTYVGTMECVQRLGFAKEHFAEEK